jgi:hypothetical protein
MIPLAFSAGTASKMHGGGFGIDGDQVKRSGAAEDKHAK